MTIPKIALIAFLGLGAAACTAEVAETPTAKKPAAKKDAPAETKPAAAAVQTVTLELKRGAP